MRCLSFLLFLLFASVAFAGDKLLIIREKRVSLPSDACLYKSGIYRVTVNFVVQPSGSTSNIQLAKSSGYRSCDLTAFETIAARTYSPIRAPVHITESVSPFECSDKHAPARAIPIGS